MNQELVVVYDIRQERVLADYLVGILCPLGWWGALLLFALMNAARPEQRGKRLRNYVLGAAFAVCGVLGAFSGYADYLRAWARHRQAVEWLQSGDHQVVEGEVTKFHPMPHSGHTDESFTVGKITFYYSDYDLSEVGFRNTTSHGGPIRDGLHVRIAHRDARILRLEVRR